MGLGSTRGARKPVRGRRWHPPHGPTRNCRFLVYGRTRLLRGGAGARPRASVRRAQSSEARRSLARRDWRKCRLAKRHTADTPFIRHPTNVCRRRRPRTQSPHTSLSHALSPKTWLILSIYNNSNSHTLFPMKNKHSCERSYVSPRRLREPAAKLSNLDVRLLSVPHSLDARKPVQRLVPRKEHHAWSIPTPL